MSPIAELIDVEELTEKISLDYLYEKAKGICYVCKKRCSRTQASREHVIPRSIGGSDEESNLTISHKRCNSKRGNGYSPIYSKHHATDEKHFALLEEHNLLIQIVPQDGGAYIIISRKRDDHV